MTIGSALRQAREQGGLTLVEISQRTKIRVPVLRAIERDDFRQLPGGAISRGFLKLFAREVGLDADDIGRRFTAEFEADELERPVSEVPGAEGRSVRRADNLTVQSPRGARTAALALAVLALLPIGYFVLRPFSGARFGPDAAGQSAARGASAGAAVATPPAAQTAAPASSSASSGPVSAATPETASGTTGTTSDTLRVNLDATAACWITATVDGKQVAYRALNPGERLALSATTEVILRIGIPGNLTISINDQRVPPSARPGTPVTLRITPQNYRDLLKQ